MPVAFLSSRMVQLVNFIDWDTDEEIEVIMYQHLNWPDGEDPKDPYALFEIIHSLKDLNPYCTVVHGCTGSGRTGTFIALIHLINDIHCGSDYRFGE